jgi:pimeloyl-ACP methyl ester carboxylesterase
MRRAAETGLDATAAASTMADPFNHAEQQIMSAGARLPGTPDPMHRWQGVGGTTIAGDSWGDPAGPLIVLQHGGGQTRHAWKSAGETLGRAGYHAVAIDARGHGDSDWAADGVYGQDVNVEDLVCVLEQLGGKRPVLVGASMGGGTSLVAIGEDRVDATALVMVDIAPQIEPEGVKKIGDFMNFKPEGFDSLEEVADAIAAYQPHRERPKDLSGLGKNLRLAPNGKYRWHWDPRFMVLRRDMHKRTERLIACSQAVKLPTLLVRGGLSDVLSEAGAQHFLGLCPHSEYVNITGAGHMVAGDRNDVFGNAVVEFLSRTVPIAGQPVQPAHETHPHHEGPPGDIIDVP